MQTLKLNRRWDSGKGVLEPGEYRIPVQITHTLAKCASADGAGEIVTEKKPKGRPRKEPAPENKAFEGSRDTKG